MDVNFWEDSVKYFLIAMTMVSYMRQLIQYFAPFMNYNDNNILNLKTYINVVYSAFTNSRKFNCRRLCYKLS